MAAKNAGKHFGPLPLAGRRILVTRAPHQASELAESLQRLGAFPILIPTIEIAPPSSFHSLDQAILSPGDYHLVAFTSANAVRAFASRAFEIGRIPAARRIAVVGPATARAVEEARLRVDMMPKTFTAEALAELLADEVRGRRILLVLAENAPDALELSLKAVGAAEVKVAAAYCNRIPPSSLPDIAALLSDPSRMPHAITFTSASTATNLAALLEVAGIELPGSIARVSIGPITSKAMRELGIPAHAEAPEATIAALVQAVAAHLNSAL